MKNPQSRLERLAIRRGLLAGMLAALCFAALGMESADELLPEVEQTLVLDLRYRTAEEVLAVLTPHLARQSATVSASEDRLLLRGGTRELGALIDLILAIDIPLRTLQVSIALADPLASGVRADPPEAAAKHDEVHYGTGAASPSAPAQTRRYGAQAWRKHRGQTHSIGVREGAWAWIWFQGVQPGVRFPAAIRATPRVEIFTMAGTARPPAHGRGLRVRPHLVGDQVTLDLAFIDAGKQGAALYAVDTRVSGGLGDWIAVTRPAEAALADGAAGLIARTRPQGPPGILVRVDLADPRLR